MDAAGRELRGDRMEGDTNMSVVTALTIPILLDVPDETMQQCLWILTEWQKMNPDKYIELKETELEDGTLDARYEVCVR